MNEARQRVYDHLARSNEQWQRRQISRSTGVAMCVLLLLTFAADFRCQKPLPEIDATTKDGRHVTLKPDGTWKFSDDKASPASPGHTVSVQAALIFQSGDVVPVPRTEFFLLSPSLEDLVATSANRQMLIDDARSRSSPDLFGLLEKEYRTMGLKGFVRAGVRGGTFSKRYEDAFSATLAAAVKYKMTTDFQGNGSFAEVPPGEYYLFGTTEIRKQFVVWHVKVTVGLLDQKIILDSNNLTFN